MLFVPTFQATSKLIKEEREVRGLQHGGLLSSKSWGKRMGTMTTPFFLLMSLGSSFSTAWHTSRHQPEKTATSAKITWKNHPIAHIPRREKNTFLEESARSCPTPFLTVE